MQDIGGGLYNMDASRLASGVGNTLYSTVVGGLGTAMDPAGAAQALKVRLGLNKNERENLKNTINDILNDFFIDMVHLRFNISIFFKDNRIFYVGILFIIIGTVVASINFVKC